MAFSAILWFLGSWKLLGRPDICNYGCSGVHWKRWGQVSDWTLRRKSNWQCQQEDKLPGGGARLRPVQMWEGERVPCLAEGKVKLNCSYLKWEFPISLPTGSSTNNEVHFLKWKVAEWFTALFCFCLCAYIHMHRFIERDIYIKNINSCCSCCVPSHSFYWKTLWNELCKS